MDHSLTFARHFSRLIWLFLNEPDGYDAQLATLRALVAISQTGPVRLAASDWHLVVDGERLPERFTGAQDLTAQLIGHSVVEVLTEKGASPTDLLCIARILASEAVPGDGGRNVELRLQALDARTIHVKVEAPPGFGTAPALANSSLAATIPGMVSGAAAMVRGIDPDLDPAGESDEAAMPEGFTDEADIVREQDPEEMFQVFSASVTPKGSMVKLFETFDNAKTGPVAARQLEGLIKLAIESARKERIDIVADVMHGIVTRDAERNERTARRQLGLAIRRLSTPLVLRCVAELLPRRRENYDQYMAIFARCEDAGVEALVDALVSAPSITDRRVYYDSLLRLGTGVRTLIHMLGDSRWYVARNAIELLGEMRVAEADDALTRLLEHRDDRVRTAAASALAKLGTMAAAKGARGALRDASAEVRERAAEALAHNRGSSADSLIRALDKEEDNRVQMAMLAALGQLGTPQAVEKLVEIARTDKGLLFRRRPTPLRVAAVHALGEVRSTSALAALQALLRDKEKQVRGAASWIMMGRKRDASAAGERAGHEESEDEGESASPPEDVREPRGA